LKWYDGDIWYFNCAKIYGEIYSICGGLHLASGIGFGP